MTAPPEPSAWALEVTTTGGTDTELASDTLWQAGAVAIEERDVAGSVVLVAATADSGRGPAPLAAAVADRWPAVVVPVDVDAALDAWRDHAQAVVGGPFLVRPPWVPAPVGDRHLEVVIDPGRAFGSGAHASTRVALAALGPRVRRGARVLDVGCGSGVLAIAALRAGAATAVGVDIDRAALAATRANAARNGVAARISVAESLPQEAPAARFDLVVANMLAEALVALAPAVRAHLAPGGHLVLSGFLAAQEADVLAAYRSLEPSAEQRAGNWVATVFG